MITCMGPRDEIIMLMMVELWVLPKNGVIVKRAG